MIYGYVRVSTNKQIDNTSCESQAEQIVARFPDVSQVFKDDGVSGSVPLFERPAGRALRALLKKGDTLVVSKLDRGFRSTEDFLTTFRTLEDEGIDLAVLALGGGEPIGKNAIAKALVSMLAVFGELERAMIAERTAEGREVTKEAGFHIGGRAPFGHIIAADGKLVRLDWHDKAVAYIVELRNQGFSLREIAAAASKHFDKVSHATVAKILEGRGK